MKVGICIDSDEHWWEILIIVVYIIHAGLSLKIEIEERNKEVQGGSGVLLIAALCLKCNNNQVIKAF